MKKIILLIIIIVLAAAGLAINGNRNKNLSHKIVPVSYGKISNIIVAQGRIEALKEVNLSSEIGGTIKEILVKEGDWAEKDQVILKFNDAYVQAVLEKAKAKLNEVNLRYNRTRELYREKVVTQANFEGVETELKLAQADVKLAEASLDDKIIKSTIKGKIIHKYFEVGETVYAGIPIFTIADLSKLLAKVEVDETDAGKLRLGQRAEITGDGLPGKVLKGKVIEINAEVGKRKIELDDPSKITDMKILETKIELELDEELKLGIIVDARITALAKENVLVIPKKAVRNNQDGDWVTMLDKKGDEVAKKVKLGYYDDWDVEILEGLNEGDQVVLPVKPYWEYKKKRSDKLD